jgi:hypothetical protein
VEASPNSSTGFVRCSGSSISACGRKNPTRIGSGGSFSFIRNGTRTRWAKGKSGPFSRTWRRNAAWRHPRKSGHSAPSFFLTRRCWRRNWEQSSESSQRRDAFAGGRGRPPYPGMLRRRERWRSHQDASWQRARDAAFSLERIGVCAELVGGGADQDTRGAYAPRSTT